MSSDAKEFAGKVAFVTGGASGIGRCTLDILCARGASAAVVDIRRETAERAAAELSGAHGVRCIGIGCDVARWPEVEAAVARARRELGGLHLCLNAAGLPAWVKDARGGPLLHDFPVEDWNRMMDVNCNGVFHCTKAEVAQFLADDTKGSIVNISSIAGQKPLWLSSAYVTSKHAVIGITRSAGIEYARKGIRTNAIAPGYVATPMLAAGGDTADPDLIQQTPMGRVGKPEEIADLIVFLLSEKASFISGSVYNIDGGWENSPAGATQWAKL